MLNLLTITITINDNLATMDPGLAHDHHSLYLNTRILFYKKFLLNVYRRPRAYLTLCTADSAVIEAIGTVKVLAATNCT